MNYYQNNNIKKRHDGCGDGWADAHRILGQSFNMSDLDGIIGNFAFAQNTGDRLFVEYVPDNIINKRHIIRKFGYIAVFDRKQSITAIENDRNIISTAFYLDLCRRLGKGQPSPPKFFYVIGRQEPPWKMIEINIETGEYMGNVETLQSLNPNEWQIIWRKVGLIGLRYELRQWIDPIEHNSGRP